LKNTEISNFIKICPVGAELFHADRQRQTDMKPIVTLDNLVNMPNKTNQELL